jgi:uncharacterized repeat protein (TIGR03943 family)
VNPYPHPPAYPDRPPRRIDLPRLANSLVLTALGAVLSAKAWDGSYAAFVRTLMRWPLLAAGLVLLAAGLTGLAVAVAGAVRPRHALPHHEHRHRLNAITAVALLPVAVLVLLRPAALDAAATDRVATAPPTVDTKTPAKPLPGDPNTPLPMKFDDLEGRALAPGGIQTLYGHQLLLEGFIPSSPRRAQSGEVRIGRYMIWCCAADASFADAYLIWPAGTARPHPADWYRAVVRLHPGPNNVDHMSFDVLRLQPERAPADQYEH